MRFCVTLGALGLVSSDVLFPRGGWRAMCLGMIDVSLHGAVFLVPKFRN